MNALPVGVAAVAAFVASGAYYGALGSRLARLSPAYAGPGRPAAATAAVELVRNVVLALVVAWLADGDIPVVALALALWIAFPAVLLVGSVFHERVPVALAAIHAGDWLIKLLLITGIVGL
ncbi:MAG: DUF1761 domain-containing protein [Pseudonocardia sp.]|nr:DUF1761 domain-containing protein [Pseudonocardia sp.]